MKRWSTLLGTVFAVLIMSVVLYLYGGDLRNVDFADATLLPSFAGAVVIYVGVILIGALGWRVLLAAFGAPTAPWVAERQLLVSQIGKYVPGNIAQYVGRAAMAVGSGVPARTVGIALVTEASATVIGGFLAVAASLALDPEMADSLRQILPDSSAIAWLFALVAALLILLLGASRLSTLFTHFGKLPELGFGGLIAATLLYILSFLLLGVSLSLIISLVSSTPVPMTLAVALFASAWIAGLATPGAPGGLGVRESIITLGLAPFLGGAAALSVAIIHRGASVLGDVISFGLGLLLPKTGEAA